MTDDPPYPKDKSICELREDYDKWILARFENRAAMEGDLRAKYRFRCARRMDPPPESTAKIRDL